jgi:hypothetical protein
MKRIILLVLILFCFVGCVRKTSPTIYTSVEAGTSTNVDSVVKMDLISAQEARDLAYSYYTGKLYSLEEIAIKIEHSVENNTYYMWVEGVISEEDTRYLEEKGYKVKATSIERQTYTRVGWDTGF